MVQVDFRKYEYAKCAATLRNNIESSGAEAMFDQALTNGLLAIVAVEWPGKEFERPGRLKSAHFLLAVIMGNADETQAGVWTFRSRLQPPIVPNWLGAAPKEQPKEFDFSVAVATLQDAIDRTQVIRHGRTAEGDSSPRLSESHVSALCALDAHPSLETLSEGERDRSWFEAKIFDLWCRGNAEDYLELIGEEEADRRVELADRFGTAPGDIGGPYIQDCPVCLREAFVASSTDYMGNNVGIGQCLVCGYYRSVAIAEDQAMTNATQLSRCRARWPDSQVWSIITARIEAIQDHALDMWPLVQWSLGRE